MKVNAPPSAGDRQWSTIETATVVDATYRQLHRWVQLGVFGDADQPAGSGTRIVLDDADVEQAWIAARLVELGCEQGALVAVMDQVRTDGRPATGQVLIVFPDGTSLRQRRSNVFPPEPCWCVPLRTADEIVAEWKDRAWQRS